MSECCEWSSDHKESSLVIKSVWVNRWGSSSGMRWPSRPCASAQSLQTIVKILFILEIKVLHPWWDSLGFWSCFCTHTRRERGHDQSVPIESVPTLVWFQFLLLSVGAGGGCAFSFASFFSSSSLKKSRGNIPRMQPIPTPMALPCTREVRRKCLF